VSFYKAYISLILIWAIAFPLYAAPNLTLTYAGDSAKPVAGVKLTQTESDGTVTVYASNSNGEVTLNTTANTYTLSASLAETGDDPVDLLDAIWILQHGGELRVLDPSLIFLDTTTNEALSETTFSPTDTPSITVIRLGDVDQSFDPGS
jgi:hypothetical protein